MNVAYSYVGSYRIRKTQHDIFVCFKIFVDFLCGLGHEWHEIVLL